MPTVVLDKVRGAELEQTRDATRYVRTGHVDDIDIADTNDPDALVKVLQLLPDFNAALGAQSVNMKLSRIRVRPEEAKFKRVNVDLLYETNTANFTPTAYMLRDRTFSIQKRDHFIPGTRVPMMLGFEATGTTPTAAETVLLLPKQSVFFDMNFSARSIQLTMLMYGRPEGGSADFNNYVNNGDWPTGDFSFDSNQTSSPSPFGTPQNMESATAFPKGYWRLASYATEFNRQAGMTFVQSEAVTKIIEDWSHVGMAMNEQTRRYPFMSLGDAERTSILADMNNADYAYGIIYPTGSIKHRGIGRWGPYPMTNFSDLFGF